MLDVEIREFREGDAEAFLALHNRAFGPSRDPAHWAWRFRDAPDERTDLLGAFTADGTCLASYGGVTVRCVIDGALGLAMNHGDVAVDPELRNGLGGSRLLKDVTVRFFERCGRRVQIIWGFPDPGLLRIAGRFCGVSVLRDVAFLVRTSTAPLPATATIRCSELGEPGAELDELWQRVASGVRVGTQRDARYLAWRYWRNPTARYQALAARDATSDRLRGVVIQRDGGWQEHSVSLCEWLVPIDDRDAERALIAHVAAAAIARQRPVVAWFAGCGLLFHRFQVDHGFFVQPTSFQQGFRSWVPKLTRHELQEHWYQTMGDMDFC